MNATREATPLSDEVLALLRARWGEGIELTDYGRTRILATLAALEARVKALEAGLGEKPEGSETDG